MKKIISNNNEIFVTIENLKQYIKDDIVYKKYIKDDIVYKKYKKSSEKERLQFSDFDMFCVQHCRDIEILINAYLKGEK